MVSPISGTVVSVSATAGTPESAGSTSFVVAGLDSYEAVTQRGRRESLLRDRDLCRVRVGRGLVGGELGGAGRAA